MDRKKSGIKTRRSQRGFSLIELMMVVGIIGILASIALPNFWRYQTRTRQAEAKTSLGAIYMGEIVYLSEEGRYGSLGEIRYVLTGANRYTYRTGAAGAGGGANANVITPGPTWDTINASVGTIEAEGTTVAMNGPTGFTATAAANLDADPAIDRWFVNDLKRDLQFADSNDVSS